MSERIVSTQAELDQALADGAEDITIRSPRGVWLNIGDTGESRVTVGEGAQVDRCGGSVGRVVNGGSVEWVVNGGSVGRVDNGGSVFSPSPVQAKSYDEDAARFLECTVRLSDLRPITDSGTPKCKVPRAVVVREVDIAGRPVEAEAVES